MDMAHIMLAHHMTSEVLGFGVFFTEESYIFLLRKAFQEVAMFFSVTNACVRLPVLNSFGHLDMDSKLHIVNKIHHILINTVALFRKTSHLV